MKRSKRSDDRRNIKRRKEKFGYESNSLIGLDLAGAAANVIAPDAAGDEADEPTAGPTDGATTNLAATLQQ